MTAEETLQPAPSFKRAALGFLTSTACLCLAMLALSSFYHLRLSSLCSTFSCNSASDLSSGRAHPSLPLDFASATASVSAKGSALPKASIRVAA